MSALSPIIDNELPNIFVSVNFDQKIAVFVVLDRGGNNSANECVDISTGKVHNIASLRNTKYHISKELSVSLDRE